MYLGNFNIPKNRDFRERILSSLSSNEVYLARREDPDATELINQLETTDTIIGGPTAETMVTTLGKLPDVLYDMDETTVKTMLQPDSPTSHLSLFDNLSQSSPLTIESTTQKIIGSSNELTNYGNLFTILIIMLVILLLLSCGVACLIAKTRQNSSTDCALNCPGAKQPLIRPGKSSPCISQMSIPELRR